MISNFYLIFLNQTEKKFINKLIVTLIEWTTLIYLSILLLSYFRILLYESVATIYIIVNMVLIIRLFRKKDELGLISIKDKYKKIQTQIKSVTDNSIDKALLFVIIAFVVGYGVVALFAVPYNTDSLTYHAPRICHWVQNKSVQYYATHSNRQNVSTILAGYISTYMYILTFKSQQAMCWIQYIAYVINAVFVYDICKKIGVSYRYRLYCVILWLTLPISFAEAITPMNDLLSATWLLAFIIYIIPMVDGTSDGYTNKSLYKRIIVLAFCIGYAYITKPSVCFAMVVFLVWYAFVMIGKLQGCVKIIKNIVVQCLEAGIIISLILTPQFVQNQRMLGSAMSDSVGKRQLVGTFEPAYMLMNFIKNVVYNFAIKIFGFRTDGIITDFLYYVANVLHVDLNNETISEEGIRFYYPHLPNYSSEAAINVVFALVILVSVIYIIINRKRINSFQKKYAVASIVAYFVFCLFLRWEASISRYMIGYFAILIPIVGVLFVSLNKKNTICVQFVFIFVISVSTLNMLAYLVQIHPVLNNKSNFTFYHDQYELYVEACEYINESSAKSIGLIGFDNTLEFPLWNLVEEEIEIESIDIDNPSKKYEDYEFVPDMILTEFEMNDTYEYHGCCYEKKFSNRCWNIYLKK